MIDLIRLQYFIHFLLNTAQMTVSHQFIADKSSKQFRRQKRIGPT